MGKKGFNAKAGESYLDQFHDEIVALHQGGAKLRDLASRYGVTHRSIGLFLRKHGHETRPPAETRRMDLREKYGVKAGDRFHRLTVIDPRPIYRTMSNGRKPVYLACRCDCGKEVRVKFHRMRKGETRSCGCIYESPYKGKSGADCTQFRHGQTQTRLYRKWASMKSRCHNPRSGAYRYYGAKGVTVCEEWREDFAAFEAWAFAVGYKPGLTIDRIDFRGNYEPSNCRWITLPEQARNRSDNRNVEAFGEQKCTAAWSEDPRCRVKASTILARLNRGWDPEDAIATPYCGPGKKAIKLARQS